MTDGRRSHHLGDGDGTGPVSDAGPVSPAEWKPAVEDIIGIGLLLAILAIMLLAVFFRYVLNDSLGWPEEASRYGLAYLTFVGLITGIRRGTHMRINALDEYLPELWKRYLDIFIDGLTLVFCIMMTVLAFRLGLVVHRTPSAAMEIPMSLAYGAVVVGSAGACVRLGWKFVKRLRGIREPALQ